MADLAKKPTTPEAPLHKIRMTLTSTNVKVLEKGMYSATRRLGVVSRLATLSAE